MKTWVKVVIALAVVAILAVTAGPFIYINFIKDEPPKTLSLDDAPTPTNAVDVNDIATTPSTSSTTTSSASTDTSSAPAVTDAAPTDPSGVDGTYTVTSESQVGYRVVEVLFGQDTEGVGRTNSVRSAAFQNFDLRRIGEIDQRPVAPLDPTANDHAI